MANLQRLLVNSFASDKYHGKDCLEEGNNLGGIHPRVVVNPGLVPLSIMHLLVGDSMPNEQGKNSRFLNLLQTFWTCYWTQMKIIKASFEPFW